MLRITDPTQAARVAVLALRGWPFNYRAAKEFEEDQHPRDDKGKFTDGSGSGSGSESKVKAAPVSKEQKDKAYEMVKSGKTHKATAAELGMSIGQVAGHVWKVDQKKKAIEESAKYLGGAKVIGGELPGPSEAKAAPPVVEEPKVAEPKSWAAMSSDEKMAATMTSEHVWKQKTDGIKTGHYAWFDKNGTQVSSPFESKSDHRAALDTLYQGKGISAATAAATNKQPDTPGWPISNNAVRSMPSSFETKMNGIGDKWLGTLPSHERNSLNVYTGSGYVTINSALRDGKWNASIHSTVNGLDSALAKSPNPPPPDLVWRGVRAGEATEFAKSWATGDTVELRGYQSSSISPSFASDWARKNEGGTLYEIKPTKGAYVNTISVHKQEKEYLLPHGARFLVKGRKEISISNGTKREVIQLEMHP